MATKNVVPKAQRRTAKPILTDKAVCTYCGAEIADDEPVVCCVRGLLSHLESVLAHFKETLQR